MGFNKMLTFNSYAHHNNQHHHYITFELGSLWEKAISNDNFRGENNHLNTTEGHSAFYNHA